jgi:hypothetical protein
MTGQNKIIEYILEAAVEGITKSYLSQNANGFDIDELLDYVSILTLHELLREYSDKRRNFVSYKTTQKGITYLMNAKSLHTSPVNVASAWAKTR